MYEDIKYETALLAVEKGCNLGLHNEYYTITQASLAKWLRDEKEVFVYPFYSGSLGKEWYCNVVMHNGINLIKYVIIEDTYEGAFERGLLEGLKTL